MGDIRMQILMIKRASNFFLRSRPFTRKLMAQVLALTTHMCILRWHGMPYAARAQITEDVPFLLSSRREGSRYFSNLSSPM
jgi:hypothetical protein